jgi:hypothetical protein
VLPTGEYLGMVGNPPPHRKWYAVAPTAGYLGWFENHRKGVTVEIAGKCGLMVIMVIIVPNPPTTWGVGHPQL